MKIILDECVPYRFKQELAEYDSTTVSDHGLGSLENGKLLSAIQTDFDVLITVDKNLPHQQNLERYELAVIVLDTTTSQLHELKRLVPALKETLQSIAPKQLVKLKSEEPT